MFIHRHKSKGTFQVVSRKIAPGSQLSTRWLLKCLQKTRKYAGGKLLDIGCGEKPYRELFNAEKHVGGDWPDSLHSRRRVDVAMHAAMLPFKPQSFNTVLMTEVLEHLDEPVAALREIKWVLKPGGHLILSVPFFYLIHESPHDYFRYTHFGLKRMMEKAGLQIIDEHNRGGAFSVSIDVSTRTVSMHFSQILKKFRIDQKSISSIQFWTVGVLQIGLTACLFACYRIFPKLAGLLDPSNRITLGYVMVIKQR